MAKIQKDLVEYPRDSSPLLLRKREKEGVRMTALLLVLDLDIWILILFDICNFEFGASAAEQRKFGSQTVGAKLHSQEGNSPDCRLRSLSQTKWKKEVRFLWQLGGWLRSSHPLKSA